MEASVKPTDEEIDAIKSALEDAMNAITVMRERIIEKGKDHDPADPEHIRLMQEAVKTRHHLENMVNVPICRVNDAHKF